MAVLAGTAATSKPRLRHNKSSVLRAISPLLVFSRRNDCLLQVACPGDRVGIYRREGGPARHRHVFSWRQGDPRTDAKKEEDVTDSYILVY